jgi:hypothetical protein
MMAMRASASPTPVYASSPGCEDVGEEVGGFVIGRIVPVHVLDTLGGWELAEELVDEVVDVDDNVDVEVDPVVVGDDDAVVVVGDVVPDVVVPVVVPLVVPLVPVVVGGFVVVGGLVVVPDVVPPVVRSSQSALDWAK